jgi:restriction endonuclease Mrr
MAFSFGGILLSGGTDFQTTGGRIALVFIFVGAIVASCLWLSARSHNDQVRAERARQDSFRLQEEERIRNSPEAIEKRRQDAERMRRCQEEQEQHRKAEEQRQAREKWNEYHRAMRIEEVDDMSGIQFEYLVHALLERTGYTRVRLTPTNDQGADILCDSPVVKTVVVQTKRWRGPVGNSAIQEVMGALIYYDAEQAMVFTNSRFTESAQRLASKNSRVKLVARHQLASMLEAAFPKEVPEFEWEAYNTHVKGWHRFR